MAASPFFVDPEGNEVYEPVKSRAVSVRDVSMRAQPPTTAVAVNTRPNFTFKPNLNVMDPPARLGYTPPPQGAPGPIPSYHDRGMMQPDASVGERTRARTAGIGAAPAAAPVEAASTAPAAPPETGLRGTVGRAAGKVAGAAKSIIDPVAKWGGAAVDGLRGAAKMATPVIAGQLAAHSGGVLGDLGVGENAVQHTPADPAYLANVNAIPGAEPGSIAPAAQAPNFFRDTELGRNTANTLNAVGGVTGATSAMQAGLGGLRAGSTASRVLNPVAGAVEAFSAANAAGVAPPTLPAQPLPGTTKNGEAAPSFEPAGPLMGTNGPQQPTVQRINKPGQNPLFTDGSRGDGLRLGVVPGYGDEARAIDERTSKIYADMRDIQGRLDAYGPGGQGGGGAAGIDGARAAREANAATDKSQLMDDLKRMASGGGRGAAAATSALAALSASTSGGDDKSAALASAERIAGMRERGETARANASHALTMRGQDMAANNNRLDNETQRAGQEQTARTAAATAQRLFEKDEKEFGAKQAEANRVANEAAIKSQQDRLENRFRTTDASGKDVPDTAKIADFHTAVDATIPELIKELRASSKPGAAAKAKQLEDRGRAALDDTALDEIMQLYERRNLGQQSDGWMPGTGNFVRSPNLLEYRQRGGDAGIDKRFIGSDAAVLENGTRINLNSVRSGKAINAYNPNFFGDETSQYSRGLRGN